MSDLEMVLKELECRLGVEPAYSDSKKPEILVVDDDGDLRSSLFDVLKSRYAIVACENGDKAIRNCTSSTKLILLDIKMPGKNGLQVFREIKECHPDVPIVFFTAHPGYHEDYLESKRLEPFAILDKGCGVDQLIDLVEKALKPENMN